MHVHLAAAILVQLLEPRLQIGVARAALLALAHERAELVKVELAVLIRVRRVALHRVLAHAHFQLFFTVA